MTTERERNLGVAIEQIERQFGRGSVMRLGEATARLTTEVIPTGCLPLDIALGVGGLPRGRVVEIYGNEASGKTTLAYHVMANAQRMGGTAAFIDAEHALDPAYAKAVGMDTDELLISQPDTGEQALEIADTLVRSGAIDVFVVDSVAALVPQAELEGEMGDQQMGLQARLMSKALRKLSGNISRSNTLGIFINQLREKIGVMFGNPEQTPGGRALKFWASVRVELRRLEMLKRGTDIIGARTRAKIVKNKVAAPFRQADLDIIYGQGISRASGLIDLGAECKVINKSGAHFTFGEVKLGQGRDAAREYLQGNLALMDDIESKIRAILLPTLPKVEEEAEPAAKKRPVTAAAAP